MALASAGPGEVVVVGACEVRGSFVVPAGVTLRGTGATSIVGSVAGAASVLDLVPAVGTRVERLRVEVDHGGLGVRAVEGPEVQLEDVTIRVSRGIGVGLRDLERASVAGLELEGPLTAETAALVPTDPSETGTFGLLAVRVGGGAEALRIERLHASGFALAALSIQAGALRYMDSDERVDIEATRFLGLAAFDTDVEVSGVEIAGLFSGLGGVPVGLAVSGAASSASVRATDISISGYEGYGLFASEADVVLSRAAIRDLGQMAVRVQGGSLAGSELVIERNASAGIAAIDARSVSIEASRVAEQRLGITTMPDGSVRTADGIQVVRDLESATAPAIDLVLSDVRLERNERAGLLLDAAGGMPARLALDGVSVQTEGTALGAVAQRTVLPAMWDASVVREGSALANDASFAGGIDVFGIMMPPALVALPPPF